MSEAGQPEIVRRRVLIAEDEALVRLDLAEMLVEEGYEVVGEAGDGETAVRLAEELRPDLVILDIKMPIMDGLAAAERIAEAHIAPVVIVTSFGQRDLVERARAVGAMAYLVKPFQKSDLIPAIQIAMSRFVEVSALEKEGAGLTERRETRKMVDRAKALLTTAYGMTEPQAFNWIQRTAMDHRLALREVAERVIAGSDLHTNVDQPTTVHRDQYGGDRVHGDRIIAGSDSVGADKPWPARAVTGSPRSAGTTDSIAVDAYLDTNERAVAQRVLKALDEVALLLGYEGPAEEQWFNGSIWRRARATRKGGVNSEEIRTRLIKLERALELIHVDTRQAEVDAKTAEAVTRLIDSLADVPQACLRVGSILIVKYSADGMPALLTRNLSQLEIRALERFPEIQTNPRSVLQALATAIASLPPADQTDQSW